MRIGSSRMLFDLDIIRQGRSSFKVGRLVTWTKPLSKLQDDNLRELSIFVRTPGFRQNDVLRLMPGLSRRMYYHAHQFRFEGDVDMILENARSITREDARGLTERLIEGGAGEKGQLPSCCLQELIQTKMEGTPEREIARQLGVDVKRVRFWCRSRRPRPGKGGNATQVRVAL
jgi:hypothetical protein